jgi:hypothetical protein
MSTMVEATEPESLVKQEIEHFIHAPGVKMRVASGAATETIREVLVREEIFLKDTDGVHVFVGECLEALVEPDDVENGADCHAPVEIDLTLAVLDIEMRRHVHVHTCRHIATGVNFGGDTKSHRFSPNTTVGVATEWARRKFRIDPTIAHEYVLQICNSLVQPRSDEHLGDLVHGDTCSLCFDLVKELTPKG